MFAMPPFTGSSNTAIAKPEVVICLVVVQVAEKSQRHYECFQGRPTSPFAL